MGARIYSLPVGARFADCAADALEWYCTVSPSWLDMTVYSLYVELRSSSTVMSSRGSEATLTKPFAEPEATAHPHLSLLGVTVPLDVVVAA